jgi:hypothetical protein
VDFTVYVPDELGEQLKSVAPKLNLSALFRHAVKAELERRARLAEMAADAQEFEFDLQTPDGDPYRGVLRGRQLTKSHKGVTFYETADGRVMVHDDERREVFPIHDAGREDGYASREDYIAVSAALGKPATVEL